MDVDFVVIELLPMGDWGFDFVLNAAGHFVDILKKKKINYSYLIDNWVGPGWYSSFQTMEELLRTIVHRNMTPNLTKEGKPLYFSFNPPPELAYDISQKFKNYTFLHPTFIENWNWNINTFNKYCTHILHENPISVDFFRDNDFPATPKTRLHTLYGALRCFQFWAQTDELLSLNDYCPVIPGYDDMLMEREPQRAPVVPRRQGKTLVEQFQAACALDAENILIYGWNEYFEATTIEPTLEYGDFYVELTKHLIEQVHRGEQITFPGDLAPRKGDIVYLTPQLRDAAQRHADKLPRWDADDYQAEIIKMPPPVIKENKIFFDTVQLRNIGTKAWPVRSEEAPVFLGARLYDAEDRVITEGRSSLGTQDIAPDQTVESPLTIEIPDGCAPVYIKVGIVWEHEFWLPGEVHVCLQGIWDR